MELVKDIENNFNLPFFANQVVEGFITGLHKSPYHGFSVEFSEHRLYNTGESTKHIDWKLFGRTDKLFIKKYEEETNLRCQIVIDVSASMYYPRFESPNIEKPNKLLFSVYATAVLMNILKRQRDAVGLSLFAEKIKIHTPTRSTLKHHNLIYSELENVLQYNAIKNPKKTYSVEAIHQIAESIHKRSLVILFSDMLENSKHNEIEIFSALQHLKYNKHEVILFHITEPETELNLNFENKPIRFVDAETEEEVRLNPLDIKDKFRDVSNKFIEKLKLKCLQYKIDIIFVDINKGFDQILISYLLKRQKLF
tara:strand:+ start:1112 stop:2041 length:930 start_codon:yes stop_codon:yes gene_type:complete